MEHAHDADSLAFDSVAISRCRDLLGQEAEGLSDQEIDQIRQHADTMARVIVETFLEQRAAQE